MNWVCKRYLSRNIRNFAEKRTQIPTFCKHKTKAIDVLEIEELTLMIMWNWANKVKTFNLYSEIKKRLIEKGFGENEIVLYP
jgi:uncharacterized NAD(P)/FAD-binding protein YdhS